METRKQYIGKNGFEMGLLLLGFTVGNQPNQTLQPCGKKAFCNICTAKRRVIGWQERRRCFVLLGTTGEAENWHAVQFLFKQSIKIILKSESVYRREC